MTPLQTLLPENRDLRWIRRSLVFISLALAVVCLRTLKEIFIPLLFAIFFTFLIAPINRYLHRKHVPLVVIIFLITLILLAIMTLLILLLYTGFHSIAISIPRYESRIYDIAQSVAPTLNMQPQDLMSLVHPQMSYLKWLGNGSVSKILRAAMDNTIDIVLYMVLMIFYVVFIVADHNRFAERLYQLVSKQDKQTTHKMLFKIENQVIRYIVNKTLISIGSGALVSLILFALGIDFPILCGFLTTILFFIPTLGATVAVIIPVLISLLQYGFSWHVPATLISLTVALTLIGSIAEPKIFGSSLNLSPIIIIISLVFWAWIWGPIGMILAIPIMSAINIVLKEFRSMNPLTEILSDPNNREEMNPPQ